MTYVRTPYFLILLTLAAGTTVHGSPKRSAGNQPPDTPQASASLALACERQLNGIEKNITELAEAMPEQRFDFTPDSLQIPGSAFKGVRTFAEQVKHLASDNYSIWGPLTGDSTQGRARGVTTPAGLKTKKEIIQYLKESFALGHKAIATLTTENALEQIPFGRRKLPRLDLAFYALTHANDHYGQMVVYLRMCGIIPPASRPR